MRRQESIFVAPKRLKYLFADLSSMNHNHAVDRWFEARVMDMGGPLGGVLLWSTFHHARYVNSTGLKGRCNSP